MSELSADKDAPPTVMVDEPERGLDIALAERLVVERMAYYGYTPEQIEAAAIAPDHYAAGCSLDGNFGWDCIDEHGKSFHEDSDEYDRTAEWVVWVLERVFPSAGD